MKLNYFRQCLLSVCVIIFFNILTTLFRHWVFHSLGFILCGLLWILHPVMLHDKIPTPREKTIIRIAGAVLIFIGIFSRAYLY